jgi:hypothetical protein
MRIGGFLLMLVPSPATADIAVLAAHLVVVVLALLSQTLPVMMSRQRDEHHHLERAGPDWTAQGTLPLC